MHVIKQLNGHSGSTVYLMKDASGNLFVRKENNIQRNIERLKALFEAGYLVPKIHRVNDNVLDMEYIHGLDMKTYLIHNNTDEFVDFIINIFKSFSQTYQMKDYTETYFEKLFWVDQNIELPFTKEQLIQRLPSHLPKTVYHGDFTLENVMVKNSEFYMIDSVTIEYDSYIFDIAKMRQDLECKWFLRNDTLRLDTKLRIIQEALLNEFDLANDDNLLILMLLRVLSHCEKNDYNYNFLMKEIKRLWK